ncbi:hypothetical protein [Rubellimicrobium arenae]|uniref:hypothetical protein n=1 Tax=Rubellimicrobium arenae TaxID=2817372 RepID=UPI001B304D3E|nr:hypothetical protein [Rubellimicrobium arenae]
MQELSQGLSRSWTMPSEAALAPATPSSSGGTGLGKAISNLGARLGSHVTKLAAKERSKWLDPFEDPFTGSMADPIPPKRK